LVSALNSFYDFLRSFVDSCAVRFGPGLLSLSDFSGRSRFARSTSLSHAGLRAWRFIFALPARFHPSAQVLAGSSRLPPPVLEGLSSFRLSIGFGRLSHPKIGSWRGMAVLVVVSSENWVLERDGLPGLLLYLNRSFVCSILVGVSCPASRCDSSTR
jgi:hypothetical protein